MSYYNHYLFNINIVFVTNTKLNGYSRGRDSNPGPGKTFLTILVLLGILLEYLYSVIVTITILESNMKHSLIKLTYIVILTKRIVIL